MKKPNKLKAHRSAKRVIGKVDASSKGPSNSRTYMHMDSDESGSDSEVVVKEVSIADIKDAPPPGAKKDWINLHTVINPAIIAVSDSLSKTQKRRISKKNRVMIKRGLVTNPLEKRDEPGIVAKASLRNFSELESGISEASNEGGSGTVIKAAAGVPVLTNKMKKNVALREVERMKLVQAHPLYQSNPLDAIKNHLAHMNNVREQANAAQAAVEHASATASAAAASGSASDDVGRAAMPSSKKKGKGKKKSGISSGAMEV
jgi:hypothetical protein